ncbi:MAG TPA: hypothetical protein DEQ65_07550 [Ruminococcaceae bacterium]|nr:hypothetical protein [Oscillospiraceae bacterium]
MYLSGITRCFYQRRFAGFGDFICRRACGIIDIDYICRHFTFGAGDTYTGYFLANYINGMPPHECMQIATMASTIQISRDGAAAAIPTKAEVLKALKDF